MSFRGFLIISDNSSPVLDGTTRFPGDHVRRDVVREHDPFVDEVCDRFHTEAASLVGGEEDKQEPGDEADRPRYEDEHDEPDDGPAPLETHGLSELGMEVR